jgi:membrane-associated phospholipid phosphatase
MKKKLILFSIGLAVFLIGYLVTNHFPLFEPRLLPVFEFEKQIPFIPQTGWIYTSDYVYLMVMTYLLRKKPIDRYFWSFLTLNSINFSFYIAYPTIFPRENFPIESIDFGNSALYLARLVDAPTNCFPSSHIGACMLGALFLLTISRRYFFIFLSWAALISFSTLTVKQHYVIDIPGGMIVGIISFLPFFWKEIFQPSRGCPFSGGRSVTRT